MIKHGMFWCVLSGAAVCYRRAQETTDHQEEEEEGAATGRWHLSPGLPTGSARHGHAPRAGSETKRGGARGGQRLQGGGGPSTRTRFPGGKQELITDESQPSDVSSRIDLWRISPASEAPVPSVKCLLDLFFRGLMVKKMNCNSMFECICLVVK